MKNALKSTESYVTELLERQLPPSNSYHNLKHTKRVLKRVKTLSEEEGVSKK